MDIKATVSTFWKAHSTTIVKVIIATVIIVVLIFVGQWYAKRGAQQLADNLRNQFRSENQALYGDIAVLKDKTKQLEQAYSAQRGELEALRKKQKGGTDNAFNNPNKDVAAAFADNVIDSFIPSN